MSKGLSIETMMETITRQLQVELDEVKERAVKKAVEDFERQLREKMAGYTLNVLSYFSVQRHGSDIVITVRKDPTEMP